RRLHAHVRPRVQPERGRRRHDPRPVRGRDQVVRGHPAPEHAPRRDPLGRPRAERRPGPPPGADQPAARVPGVQRERDAERVMSDIEAITYDDVQAVTPVASGNIWSEPVAAFFANVAGNIQVVTARKSNVTLTINAGVVYTLAILSVLSG